MLTNSLHRARRGDQLHNPLNYLYRPYRIFDGSNQIACFFRDDRLSDRIGFEYAKWFGRDAVLNFVHSLEEIWQQSDGREQTAVSIILDGENAWEYYPYNGYYFLSELYEMLQGHPHIEMSTFSDCLDGGEPDSGAGTPADVGMRDLPHLVAGSWVYGNFTTWIGCPEKNRAWDMLCEAKQSFDLVMASGRLDAGQRERAARHWPRARARTGSGGSATTIRAKA